MKQLSYLLRKEFLELVRTKRALVLQIVFGVFSMQNMRNISDIVCGKEIGTIVS